VGLTSPPYAEAQSGGGIAVNGYKDTGDKVADRSGYKADQHGNTPGQLGALPDRPRTVAVTSPPYEDSDNRGAVDAVTLGIGPASRKRAGAIVRTTYGDADGQIGQEHGESYLEAMSLVYAAAARVCDVLCVVTKNPTRNGALRRLDKDTLALLREAGFAPVCYHQAMLFRVEERTDLFGETTRAPKGRLGFFKRLQWAKGSPVADHEDVLIAVRTTRACGRCGKGIAAHYTESALGSVRLCAACASVVAPNAHPAEGSPHAEPEVSAPRLFDDAEPEVAS
jgi:hypothetical protein